MQILCFGDSNTYGYDPRSYLDGRYPADICWVDLLARRTGWTVTNAGENGREIPHSPYELHSFCAEFSKPPQADRLIVMLGSNDLLQGCSVAAVVQRMKDFLVSVPFAHSQILLVAPPPFQPGEWVADERLMAMSRELAGQYRILALNLGIHFADAGEWHIDFTYDGVHFSEAGHHTFAEELCKCLINL